MISIKNMAVEDSLERLLIERSWTNKSIGQEAKYLATVIRLARRRGVDLAYNAIRSADDRKLNSTVSNQEDSTPLKPSWIYFIHEVKSIGKIDRHSSVRVIPMPGDRKEMYSSLFW